MTTVAKDTEFTYSEEEIDALALASCETVVAEPGTVCAYDVEAYRRITRRATPTGQYPLYNPPPPDRHAYRGPLPPECIGGQAYLLRIGGFRRGNIFGPDEAAQILSSSGVAYADSLGEGLFEHLVLCRKYGVTPVFEAPTAGFALPFLDRELPIFEFQYRREVADFACWIVRAESVYGHSILRQAGQPWVLWGLVSPLALFMLSVAREPAQTAEDLRRHSGVSRLDPNPTTPLQRAMQLKAWSFLRRRHMEVRAIMANTLREVVAPDAVLLDNTHAMPVLDYAQLGAIYDHPGVAVRSGYLEEELLREANVAFAVRVFRDLTGRTPIVSVRINMTAAGTRFIPGPNVIRSWCDTAIRHGVSGFYFWPVDYPSVEGQYFGAMPGNTDPSARGRERWDAMLTVFRDIAGARRFQPPPAKIGILVPCDSLELAGWRRVFDAFVSFENARLFAQFVPARAVDRGGDALRPFALLVAPACPFLPSPVVVGLERFVHRGGSLVVSCPEAMLYDEHGNPRSRFANLSLPLDRQNDTSPISFGSGKIYVVEDVAQAARQAGIEGNSWIYDVRGAGLRELTGLVAPAPTAVPEPDVKIRHYMYEHSSKAIMPYVEKVNTFSEIEDVEGRPK